MAKILTKLLKKTIVTHCKFVINLETNTRKFLVRESKLNLTKINKSLLQ